MIPSWVYHQCYCAINTLTQPIKLIGLRICHSLQKIITCDLYWQVFDSSHCFDCLKATRNLYSETTSANMLPVRYTFGPFRAPSLSKLEGHVPLPSIWLRRLWCCSHLRWRCCASLRCSTRCCARDSDSMYFNGGVHTYSAALVNTPEAFYQRSAVTRSVCVNGPLQSAEWKRCST